MLEVITGTENTWTPLIGVLRGHSSWVLPIAFSTDGSGLASASDDATVRLWGTRTGAHIATLRGHSGPIRSVIFSADGSRLASVSDDRTVCLWDGKTGAHRTTLEGGPIRKTRHRRFLPPVTCMTFSLDGSRLASGFSSSEVQLWDSRAGVLIATISGHSCSVNSLTLSADGSRVATASNDQTAEWRNGCPHRYPGGPFRLRQLRDILTRWL
jgi:WD40 repeat protein